MSDTIRVSVLLENGDDRVAADRLGDGAREANVRSVVTEGLVIVGDTRPLPLCLPAELVERLGLREHGRQWGGRRCAGLISALIGGRRTFGDCVVEPPGSSVRIGHATLRQLDLVPDPTSGTLRPGTGIRI